MFLAGLAQPAFAQSPPDVEVPATPQAAPETIKLRGFEEANMRRLLERREREVMHPGDPLDLVGNEEGGNDFRAATPLLSRSEHPHTLVDRDENYRRRLAMYDERARFSTPVASLGGPEPAKLEPNNLARNPVTSTEEGEGESSGFLKYLAIVLGVIAAIYAWRRRYLLQF